MNFIKSQEYISSHRSQTIRDLCGFMSTDVLLFWSDDTELQMHQKTYWQSLLDCLNGVFKLDLQITTSLVVPENRQAEEEFAKHLNGLSDKELTVCSLVASETKSVLLGLLLCKQKITATEAFSAAFLEELYQNKFWGEDAEAVNLREKVKQDLLKIEEYLLS